MEVASHPSHSPLCTLSLLSSRLSSFSPFEIVAYISLFSLQRFRLQAIQVAVDVVFVTALHSQGTNCWVPTSHFGKAKLLSHHRPHFSSAARHSVLCIPRKPVGISWFDVDAKEEFGRPSNDVRLHKQHKLSRHTVARSGLVGTGTPDAALPEVTMVSKFRGLCFYVIAAFNAIYLFALMVVAHPFVLVFDRYRRRAHIFIAKIWATFAVTPFLNIKFEGLENLPPPDAPAVYVSNHQSFLDIYVLLTIGRPYKFISKTSIFLIPIIGWAMFLLGVIPLKRMDSKSQLECLKRCIYLLKKGSSVFFFPEGTRSRDGKLGAFKKGAFSLAAKTNVPVVPITLIGTGKIMPVGKEAILNTGPVKVVIHKPIEGSDTETLHRESEKVIAEALNQG